MRKVILFSILIFVVILSVSCRSRPTPVSAEPQVPAATPAVPVATPTTPAATTPVATPAPTTPVATTPGTTYGGAAGTTAMVGNRHPSGIILDGATTYTVRRGDTLSSIARALYRDGSLYPLIMMVNSQVTDPDQIQPDMRFTIPNLRANMDDRQARESINRYFLQIANIEEQRGRFGTAASIRNHTR